MRDKSVFKYLFGMFIAIGISLGLVLILAGIVQIFSLNDRVVQITVQVIKAIAIVIGSCVCVKERVGFLKGGLFGLAFAFITFLIFGWISGGLVFGKSLIIDLLYGTIVGLISGVLAVSIKNK